MGAELRMSNLKPLEVSEQLVTLFYMELFQWCLLFIIPALQFAVSFWAYPITAKAGSSWRSKGNSIRKFVLNKAVMVTVRMKRPNELLGEKEKRKRM